ncbi:848_t:CDS:2 [Funneliformis mosseae]|uniref:848_t:CDS:1 n=1 Tax=Funneliformis mosseae TaxID=27381 RepID=A0A9N8WN06_FUNMO|nr:848_t:CDS:2 [Funneliformis mosseae]
MVKILKCPGCDREIRTGKTRDLNKHINLNRNLRKGQCLPALRLMQNPVPASVGNPAENPISMQNVTLAENPISMQNQAPAPILKSDLISFNENPLTHQPIQLREWQSLIASQ